jgi:uncharacterized protein with WD repeat
MELEKCTFRSHMVLMKGITWSRDSHGLFDYESRHLTKRTMKTTQATQIIRKTNELELLPTDKEVTDEAPTTETKQLLKIINEGEVFYLESFS